VNLTPADYPRKLGDLADAAFQRIADIHGPKGEQVLRPDRQDRFRRRQGFRGQVLALETTIRREGCCQRQRCGPSLGRDDL
jgi:hypothetical protein